MSKVHHIVLTGGPCAGKTAAVATLVDWFNSHGVQVMLVPEITSLLNKCGAMRLREAAVDNPKDLQLAILRLTIAAEDNIRRLALGSKFDRVVIISDGGVMDSKACVDEETWSAVLDELGIQEVALRDHRYDAVFHLVTTADGAPVFYQISNSRHGKETIEEAIDRDKRTMYCWLGHPHLRIIKNVCGGGFDAKLQALKVAIANAVGLPDPIENERRFLVERIDISTLPVTAVHQSIVQFYLPDGTRVRKRDGFIIFTTKIKRTDGGAGMIERESRITPEECDQLYEFRDRTRGTILKTRTLFIYDGRCFELDSFKNDELNGLQILEIETDDSDDVLLPPFISIKKEITGDEEYSNKSLAFKVMQLNKKRVTINK